MGAINVSCGSIKNRVWTLALGKLGPEFGLGVDEEGWWSSVLLTCTEHEMKTAPFWEWLTRALVHA